MPDQPDFNYEEASHAVAELRTALQRAQACADRLQQILAESPASFPALAAPTLRLRDRLVEDLGTLEARMPRVLAPSGAGRRTFQIGDGAREAEERGVSQGDVRALGGQ